jgi:quercetin dioxygenase-like cupin family protein
VIVTGIEVLGPVALRKFHLENKCDVNEGHSHNYDHVTFIQRGSIQVEYRLPNSETVQQSKTYAVGEIVLIKKDVWHTIKAMEPNTQYACVFTHRDFDTGEVVQTYNGNPEAVT